MTVFNFGQVNIEGDATVDEFWRVFPKVEARIVTHLSAEEATAWSERKVDFDVGVGPGAVRQSASSLKVVTYFTILNELLGVFLPKEAKISVPSLLDERDVNAAVQMILKIREERRKSR